MARKSLKDMSGIANTIARSGAKSSDRAVRTSAPALGALQGSLASIREIDPALIDDWGPMDRLTEFTAVNSEDDSEGFGALRASIAEGGQQVPILVRKSSEQGRYEVIYGRRRLQACRDLGIKVRANVQDLDDQAALLAKGLENAARSNLSFYEKARFAAAILEAGHDAATVRQAMSLSASGLSHLTKVTQNVPIAVGDAIGVAPKSGRPKWTSLAEHFVAGKLTEQRALEALGDAGPGLGSDDRLDLVLKAASKRSAPAPGVSLVDGVVIRGGRGSVSMTARKSGPNAEFAEWLEGHLAEIIMQAHARFIASKRTDG